MTVTVNSSSSLSTGGDTTKLNAAFTPTTGKNKFNPALAVDGSYHIYSTGALQAFANGIGFGAQEVVEGQTYTWWLPTDKVAMGGVLLCYTSSGTYLGTHIIQGAYPVAPIPPTGVVFSDSFHTVVFTIPVGSGIGKISVNNALTAHSAADFTAAVNSMQLEFGSTKTTYEPYDSAGALVIKTSTLPPTVALKTDIPTQPPALIERSTATTVVLDGTYAYIRTKWNTTLDLVQRVQYGTTTAFNNNVVNPYDVRTIPVATSNTNIITAYPSGTFIVSQIDDAAPCQYNFTYIGANHGAAILHQVTATAHGKVVQDVGSRWLNGANTFTIMRVVDANTLWLLSQNTGTTYWGFVATSLVGLPLVHVAGATNTATITPTVDVVATQMYPAIRNHVKSIKLDGRTTISASGVYQCEFVDIVNSYEICNPVSVLAYVQSQTGSATQPSFTDNSISTDMRVGVTYRYASNGSLSVVSQYQAKQNVRMNYIGAIQALPLSYSGKSLFQYIPKLNSIVGSLKTWNLSAIEDITTQIETLTFTTATWSDANNPPDRMVQFVKTGATKNHGFVLGYGMQRGNGVPNTRKTASASDCGFISASTRKMYPKLVTNSGFASSMMNAGQVVNSTAYRSFYNFDVVPNATVFTWYYDGKDIVVVFDIHESVTALSLPLPSWMVGMSATIIDSSASFSLLSPIVMDDGLLVTVTGGYGQASIKLS